MTRSDLVRLGTAALRGRTALVTGASDGIGFEIARGLAGSGARVLMPVRNRAKGERARSRIRDDVPGAHLELLDLDLARLDSVAALVATLRDTEPSLELLVLNAGVVRLGERERAATIDGFELAFQTNYLGHVLLTQGLMPLLRAGSARVAVQCSLAAAGSRVSWSELREAGSADPFRAYRTSKAAVGLFGLELARRSAKDAWGISVHLCHPGIAPGSAIAPAIRALIPESIVHWAEQHLGNPPSTAALTALAALTAPPTTVPRMFVPAGPFELAGPPRERAPFASLDQPGDARMLWQISTDWVAPHLT